MKANELITLIQSENEQIETIEALNELIDKKLSASEETVEETAEEEDEEEAEEETVEEEAAEESEETVEETAEEEAEETEPDTNLSAVMSILNDLRKDNEVLRSQLQEVQTKLAAKEKSEKEFLDNFKSLSVKIRSEEKPEVKTHKLGMTNGIGEL